ncbi:MAG: DUF4250 domain-containing protein [bacterium]
MDDILHLDPFILVSLVNAKLRNRGKHLDDLCEELAVDPTELERRLREEGFLYNHELNRFIADGE